MRFFPPSTMTDLYVQFTELTRKADELHSEMSTVLSLPSVELVEGEEKKRRENSLHLREHAYRGDQELQKLEGLVKIMRLKQGWNSSDLKTLEAYRYDLLRQRKEQQL